MVIRVGNKSGVALKGIDEARAEIHRRLEAQSEAWLQSLQEKPGEFANLEQSVHHAFQQMADRMMAGILAQATQPAEFTDAAKKK
jgi:hypothetical protein